ncbi:MAG: OmpA family protein [Desulfotignum sp.]
MKFFGTRFILPLIAATFLFGCAAREPVQPIPAFTPTPFDANEWVSSVDNLLIILDASSSMDKTYAGNKKFAIANEIVKRLGHTLPELDQNAGLRSFGHSPKVSDKNTVLSYGMEKYTQKGLDEKMGLISSAGGTSAMHEALTAAGQDLENYAGKTAVVIISDAQPEFGLESPITLNAAQALKDQKGADICFYPVFVGDDEKGMALMENLADIGQCGFSTTSDKLLTGDGMGLFVQDAFLDKKPVAAAPAPKEKEVVKEAAPAPIEGLDAKGAWRVDEAYFDFDKATVKPAAFDFLDKIVNVLKSRPELSVNIHGYTDNVGTKAYNDVLSLKRANAVKTYLTNRGIDQNRLFCQGFGSSDPAASNKTAEGRALNRRVELIPFIE